MAETEGMSSGFTLRRSDNSTTVSTEGGFVGGTTRTRLAPQSSFSIWTVGWVGFVRLSGEPAHQVMLIDQDLHLCLLRLNTGPPQLAALFVLVNGGKFPVETADFEVSFTKEVIVDHSKRSTLGRGNG
jgi:hypothetical protein